MARLERHASVDVAAAREHVEAVLGFEVWSNAVYRTLVGPAHGGEGHGED